MSNKSHRSIKRTVGVGFASLAVLALTLPACKPKKDDSKTKGTASAATVDWRVQGRVPKKMREVQNDPKLVAQGKSLYGTCAGCHGMDGSGTVDGSEKTGKSTL